MSMGMSMRNSALHQLEIIQEMSQVQELTTEQKQEAQCAIIGLRLELIQELRGMDFQIDARCPNCGRKLNVAEVLKGFNRDPRDFNTTCPRCRHRFVSELIHKLPAGHIRLPFLCPTQTLDALSRLRHLKPEEMQKENPAAFNSAIVNFGSIENAFKEAQVEYQFEKMLSWKNKVIPFLGRLPDVEIARCVAVNTAVISRLRNKNKIARFNPRDAIEE